MVSILRLSAQFGIVIYFLSFILSFHAYAWNAQGHELIAQIALMQLTPEEKKRLLAYNQAYQVGYQPRSLAAAAAWLDWLHCQETWCESYRYYHYIDIPYSIDGTPTIPPRAENALVAIQHARETLANNHASLEEKGLQLRVLMHVVGDIHQPLHNINLFSQTFPDGDKGGNRFLLGQNRIAPQLHAYWDRGGGYLVKNKFSRRRLSLKKRSKQILKRYPCSETDTLDPASWSDESYQIAKDKVYQLSLNQKPSREYHRMVVQVTQQRIALAGCRLGAVLKGV